MKIKEMIVEDIREQLLETAEEEYTLMQKRLKERLPQIAARVAMNYSERIREDISGRDIVITFTMSDKDIANRENE